MSKGRAGALGLDNTGRSARIGRHRQIRRGDASAAAKLRYLPRDVGRASTISEARSSRTRRSLLVLLRDSRRKDIRT